MGKVSEDGILLPQCEQRLYKALALPNGLEVLLVSDPESDKASAAMNVDVGYFSDPEALPGLAHFLEHMLFFASEKYPEEDSYSKFLQEHSGQANAFTSMEQTNYQLDVAWDHLDEALDRFAQFFIAPLLSADATGREVNAVHSEHSKNLTSDPWRFMQLQKSLVAPEHPYHKFGTGSRATLMDEPSARGEDPREQLLQFYHSLYSANRMHLCVYGRDSLAQLEQMVLQPGRFKDIPNKALEPLRFPGQPCQPGTNKVVVKAVPVTEGHSLELLWGVPPDLPLHLAAPSRYVSHLLGHEGHGSLFALLKHRGWATSLCAGESASSWDFAFFSVSIELTDEGHAHMEDVLELTFLYIGLLRREGGVSEDIFNEMRDICSTKFNFRDKQRPFNYAQQLSGNMQLFPKEDWVAGSSLPRTFNGEAISAVINALSPHNARVFWASKEFEKEAEGAEGPGGPWDEEQWYGTKYSSSPIAEPLLQRLEGAFESAQGAPPELHLPRPNPFVPTDFSLVTPPTGEEATPRLVQQTPLLRLWHKADSVFGLPKACLFLHLCSPAAYASPEAALLTRLLCALLLDYLNEIAYDAEIAGLSYGIYPTVQGIQVTVSGYSHKLLVLACEIVDRLAAFEVKADRFQVVKAKALKDFENYRYDQPYQQALYTASVMTEERKWHFHDYLQVLPGLEPQHLTAFAPQLLRRLFIESFAAGNLTSQAAQDFLARAQAQLQSSPLGPGCAQPCLAAEMPQRRFLRLPGGTNALHSMPAPNAKDENSALVFCCQVGLDGAASGSMRGHVLGQLLVQVLQRDTFHELRTVQQLGYIVFLMARSEGGIHYLAFIIQSNVKAPAAVEGTVEAFLAASGAKLKDLPSEEFKTHVDALVSLKREKKKNLQEDAGTVWREIDDGTLAFNRREQEVEALQALTSSDLLQFFECHVASTAPQRQKYSIHVVSSKWSSADQSAAANQSAAADQSAAAAADAIPEGGQTPSPGDASAPGTSGKQGQVVVVEDLFAFKRSMPLYPSVKGSVMSNRDSKL